MGLQGDGCESQHGNSAKTTFCLCHTTFTQLKYYLLVGRFGLQTLVDNVIRNSARTHQEQMTVTEQMASDMAEASTVFPAHAETAEAEEQAEQQVVRAYND